MFANDLPRIGVLDGNSGSTGCVRGGREECVTILSFFLYTYGFLCSDTGLFSHCRRHLTFYL